MCGELLRLSYVGFDWFAVNGWYYCGAGKCGLVKE